MSSNSKTILREMFTDKSIIALLLIVTANSWGNELALDAETVSIATGSKQPIASAAAVASVITQDDFQRYGYRTVSEALSHVPGFHVGITSIFNLSYFSVRGYAGPATLHFLVDGKPLTAAIFQSKELDIKRIPLAIVDRIEILRGPSSSLYGTDAFMGVVNVITKKNLSGTTVTGMHGSHATYNLSIIDARDVGSSTIETAIEYQSTDGYQPFVEQDSQTLLDEVFGTDASLAPGFGRLQEKSITVNSSVKYNNTKYTININRIFDKGLHIGLFPVLDDTGLLEINNVGFTAQTSWVRNDRYELSTTIGLDRRVWNLNDATYFPAGSFGTFPEGVKSSIENTENIVTGLASLRYFGLNKHNITFTLQTQGASSEITSFDANFRIGPFSSLIPDDSGSFDREGVKDSAVVTSFRVNDEIAIGRSFSLALGTNVDIYDEYPTTISPRIGLVWNKSRKLTLKALIGEGVRAPAFLETLDIGIPAIRPNADLIPEEIRSYDLIADYQFSPSTTLRGNLFFHETENRISLSDPDSPVIAPSNTGLQRGRGMEFELIKKLDANNRFRLFGHIQKNIGRNQPSSPLSDAGYSPHWKTGIKYDRTGANYKLGLSYTYVGSRDREQNDVKTFDAQTYGTLNIAASYQYDRTLTFRLKVENALDTEIFEATPGATAPYDLQLARRQVFLSLESKW